MLKLNRIHRFLLFLALLSAVYAGTEIGNFPSFSLDIPGKEDALMFFPLPAEFEGRMIPASLVLEDGTKLQAIQVIENGRLLGYHLDFRNYRGTGFKAILQLGISPDVEAAVVSCPVRVSRMQRNVTTRAFTADEILRYFDRAPGKYRTGFCSDFGELPPSEKWDFTNPNAHSCALYQWEAMLYIAEAGTVAFSSPEIHTAWALLIDGENAGSWMTGGAVLNMEEGLHTLQLFCLQRQGESLPALNVKINNQAGVIRYISPGCFRNIGMEDGAPRIQYALKRSYAFEQTGRHLNQFEIISGENGGLCFRNEVQIQHGTVLMDTWEHPGIRLESGSSTYTFPGRKRRNRLLQQFIRNRIFEAPLLVPARGDIPVVLEYTYHKNADWIIERAAVNAEYISRTGGIIKNSVQPLNGRKRIELDLEVPTEAVSIRLSTFAGNAEICSPLEIRLVRPEDFTGEVEIRSGAVFTDGERSILVCNPLSKPDLQQKNQVSVSGIKIGILEDLTGDRAAPGGDLPLEQALEAAMPDGCKVQAFTGKSAEYAGAVNALPALLDFRPDYALLCLGAEAWREGRSIDEICLLNLYAWQVCRARGIIPVAVILPPMPFIEQQICRLTALRLKEMAFAAGVETADLYSDSIAGNRDAAKHFNGKGFSLNVPDNGFRKWLAAKAAGGIITDGK